jgi:uncharacterized Zn finger protein
MFDKKQTAEFLVQGSAKEPYRAQFSKTGNNLSAYCTCPAGSSGMYCKHRFSILEGKAKGIVSDNADQVQLVQSWLAGSDVEAAMQIVAEKEVELAEAKKRLTQAKQALAAAMRD